MKLVLPICFIIPTIIPWMCWGETLVNSFFVATMFRYTTTLNFVWFINSIAHKYGSKPYDKTINPADNVVTTIFTLGEGESLSDD